MKRFSTTTNLDQHKMIHVDKSKRKSYPCRYCNKLFLYKSSRKCHEQRHERTESVKAKLED